MKSGSGAASGRHEENGALHLTFPRASTGRGPTAAQPTIIETIRDGSWITRARLAEYPKLLLAVYLFVSFCFLQNCSPAGAKHEGLGVDFVPFYATSALALRGHAAWSYNDALQWTAEKKVAGNREGSFEIWYYPPTYLLMILPSSLLTFYWSLLVWTLVTLGAYLAVVWVIVPYPAAMWLALTFPAAFINMRDGQNGCLTMSLLAGGLLLLERRPTMSGILFGLVCYKPQFGILIPIVLSATGRWRAFLSATVTVATLATVTTVLFGWDTWQAFFASIPMTSHHLLVTGDMGFFKIQSAFGAARSWHASLAASGILQAVVSLAGLGIVLWVWRGHAPFSLKAAALMAGTLLVTPYAVDYDLVLLAAPIGWLAYEGLHSDFLPWEKSILFLGWTFPLLSRCLSSVRLPFTPMVVAILLVAIARRAALASVPLQQNLKSGNESRQV
jgi:alpha-1,2-mannosyltransferase